MRILHLTIKKKFYDMIASGEKPEEYREIKRYWINRLCDEVEYDGDSWEGVFKTFDAAQLRNGYSTKFPTMLVEFKGLSIGFARPEWSDNWQGELFIIKLGNIISKS